MALVLLIEDNAGDVELVRRHLAMMPGERFEIVASDTLESGLAAWRRRPCDIVLLDLNLPDSTGLETVDAFRKEVPNAPLVVLTGTTDLDTGVAALRRGADDYLGKDHALSSELLSRTMRYAVERRRMIGSLQNERQTVALLQDVGAALAAELDRDRLVQKIINSATSLVGAEFGALCYGAAPARPQDEWRYAVSGGTHEVFERLGLPSSGTSLGSTFAGAEVVRSDDVRRDPRYGRSFAQTGAPEPNPSVASYLAVPVVLHSGTIIGGMFFGHREPNRFTTDHERLAIGVGGWAAVAMDNARLYEEAVFASRARENLLQIVSHDLRNHANTLAVAFHLLRRGVEPEKLRRVETVERAMASIRRLLEDLVDIAAVEKGVLTVAPALVDANELLRDAQSLFVPSIADRNIQTEWGTAAPNVMVWADRERILQVLGNLVGNAIKFTPTAGRICVAITTRESELEIAVEDTGPGIPEEHYERVFDRFFRGSRPSGQGAGLGLAIARALVQAHGGRIAVGRAHGGGARFHFTLLRAPPDASADRARDATFTTSGRGVPPRPHVQSLGITSVRQAPHARSPGPRPRRDRARPPLRDTGRRRWP